VGQTLGEVDGAFLIDECGVFKQGHDSAGVAPQYCGSVRKVANSQVGVFLAYASRKGYTLLDGQLFVPDAWFTDAYAAQMDSSSLRRHLETQLRSGGRMARPARKCQDRCHAGSRTPGH
jgi:SRSO17 transposase